MSRQKIQKVNQKMKKVFLLWLMKFELIVMLLAFWNPKIAQDIVLILQI